MSKEKSNWWKFTRRDLLKKSALVSLGFAFSSILTACFGLFRKELEPISVDSIWLGSSTVKDVGNYYMNTPFNSNNNDWFIEETLAKRKIFIHGEYGAHIGDLDQWLDNQEITRFVPNKINVLIGGNEISDQSSDEELIVSAKNLVAILEKAERTFPGKQINVILPFPTLINSGYEKRRRLLNDTLTVHMALAKEEKRLSNKTQFVRIDHLVAKQAEDPTLWIAETDKFRDLRHFRREIIGEMIHYVDSQELKDY